VDGAYVNTHGGDGFIVSPRRARRPTRCPAAAPSSTRAFRDRLVPICPTPFDRPIVVSADSIVEIELADRFEARAQVVCDGMVLSELEPGERLRICRASISATLLHPPGHEYYRILRSKLHWGRGGRSGQPPVADRRPMLTHLQIRDFAIVESVELELRRGFTALTGETGAGKSILVDALLLAVGGRADSGAVRHGAERPRSRRASRWRATHRRSRGWTNSRSLTTAKSCSAAAWAPTARSRGL